MRRQTPGKIQIFVARWVRCKLNIACTAIEKATEGMDNAAAAGGFGNSALLGPDGGSTLTGMATVEKVFHFLDTPADVLSSATACLCRFNGIFACIPALATLFVRCRKQRT